MDVTRFIVSKRNDALLVGDYGSYRRALSRRLLTLRRKLGRTSPKGRKYAAKAPITAEDVNSNVEFVQLQLLTAERAWAHAMYMKSMHSNESGEAITGTSRTHILSRLEKAKKSAATLVDILSDPQSGVPSNVLLETQAYHAMLGGAMQFESRKWAKCLEYYSTAYAVYENLAKASSNQEDVFQELLTSTIEPSIRYAAYQQKLPRTMPIHQIVAKHSPKDSAPIRTILERDPSALDDRTPEAKVEQGDSRELPRTISWRSRTVPIEDASISEALAKAYEAEEKLATLLSASGMSPKDRAAAYDDVLVPSQDAVDATKTAIDELTAEGVSSADKRLQALQVTRTALNYALVGWRVGRNRVLCGPGDGASHDSGDRKASKSKEETTGSKMARLRERVVLYDGIIQSVDSIKELPGVAADQALGKELESKRAYFSALRSLALARSQALLDKPKNALALFANALKTASLMSALDPEDAKKEPLGLKVTQAQARFLQQLLQGLVTRQRALVEIHTLHAEAVTLEKSRKQGSTPFVEHLDEYPFSGVDLKHLVDYPPRLKPIPVKPIFLDVAWNYIDYPGRQAEAEEEQVSAEQEEPGEEKKETKSRWWGFGR